MEEGHVWICRCGPCSSFIFAVCCHGNKQLKRFGLGPLYKGFNRNPFIHIGGVGGGEEIPKHHKTQQMSSSLRRVESAIKSPSRKGHRY